MEDDAATHSLKCPKCQHGMEEITHGVFMDAGEFKDFKFESLLDRFRSLIKGNRDNIAP